MSTQSTTIEKPRRQRRPLEVRQAELRERLDRMSNRESDRIVRQLDKIGMQMQEIDNKAVTVGNSEASRIAREVAMMIARFVESQRR